MSLGAAIGNLREPKNWDILEQIYSELFGFTPSVPVALPDDWEERCGTYIFRDDNGDVVCVLEDVAYIETDKDGVHLFLNIEGGKFHTNYEYEKEERELGEKQWAGQAEPR